MDFAEMERIMGEDPDDRAIREAHGFTFEDDWRDDSLLCRNGCGLSYPEISAGKIRACRAGRPPGSLAPEGYTGTYKLWPNPPPPPPSMGIDLH